MGPASSAAGRISPVFGFRSTETSFAGGKQEDRQAVWPGFKSFPLPIRSIIYYYRGEGKFLTGGSGGMDRQVFYAPAPYARDAAAL